MQPPYAVAPYFSWVIEHSELRRIKPMTIPDVPDGWKYVISSLVGGGIAIFVTFLNNRHQLSKDTKIWKKEKLWEGYQKCISNLNLIDGLLTNISAEGEVNYVLKKEDRKKIFTLDSEIYPYLYWIMYNHPNPQSKEIQTLKEAVKKRFSFELLILLIQELTKLMVNDPRLFQNHQSKTVYTNEFQQQDVAEAAKDIQELLKQLDETYPSDTTAGKMKIATEVITQIDNNPTKEQRMLSAIKAGGVTAFEQLLNHPAASFVIAALKDWQNDNDSYSSKVRNAPYSFTLYSQLRCPILQ